MIETPRHAAPRPGTFGPLPGTDGKRVTRCRWDRPVTLLGRGVRAAGCRCDDPSGGGQWDKAAAPYVLRDDEWMLWSRLNANPIRRRRWLRGRIAAKDAVRLLLEEHHDIVASLENIGILPNAHGAPHVNGAIPSDVASRISVSISHCNHTSAALAVEQPSLHGRSIGIDIASNIDTHDGLEEGGFAPSECERLAQCPASEREDWLLRMWCAKEAAAKAAGTGLQGNPLNVRICAVDVSRARIDVALHPALLRRRESPARGEQIQSHVGRDGELTFAVACWT